MGATPVAYAALPALQNAGFHTGRILNYEMFTEINGF